MSKRVAQTNNKVVVNNKDDNWCESEQSNWLIAHESVFSFPGNDKNYFNIKRATSSMICVSQQFQSWVLWRAKTAMCYTLPQLQSLQLCYKAVGKKNIIIITLDLF